MSRGSLEVLLTKTRVTWKPKGVTHQDKSHTEAWLSKWPCYIHITLKHSSSKKNKNRSPNPTKLTSTIPCFKRDT
jgi:hypothetical protein